MNALARYETVNELVAQEQPLEPVYCLHPETMKRTARHFLDGFPGRALYAVKVNADLQVLQCLGDAGLRNFDTASLVEIELVKSMFPEATCYFMGPVRMLGAARRAYEEFGIRHFVVDHMNALDILKSEVPVENCMVFARMVTPSKHSQYDFSSKFGASPEMAIALLQAIRDAGAKTSLAFNVGSLVRQPDAYREALASAADVLTRAGVEIHELDIGGGYPARYGGIDVEQVDAYFDAIRDARAALPIGDDVPILGEPGRALVADGITLVTQVLLRKEDQIYLNDGIYGSLYEATLSPELVYPTRCYRGEGQALEGPMSDFRLYGPTCDSLDAIPHPYQLPADIQVGDWVEFGMTGAYTLTNRTGFNGFYPERMVTIDGADALRISD